jgi:hypothetical protein
MGPLQAANTATDSGRVARCYEVAVDKYRRLALLGGIAERAHSSAPLQYARRNGTRRKTYKLEGLAPTARPIEDVAGKGEN